ncbi:MAG: VPDSG-CTERM sorting domain-containing protein [Armatimonadetes bacterium]|nr:VPDSG-CTERM sorting domain-containing protein [Armatimonadota bacterium]
MKLTKTILAALAASVMGVLASTAQAVMIDGTIGFSNPNGGTASLVAGVTTVHFTPPLTVNFGTGDYSGTTGATVSFVDISFSGSGTGATLTSTNVPEWTFTSGANTFSFDLLSLASAKFTGGSPNTLSLSGFGKAHITGFDDTVASFSLQGTGNGFTFTILQASTTAVPTVPDGGSAVALLGIALVAIEGLRRKFVA